MLPEERASEVYGPLLVELQQAQQVRKASIEQRGVTVITTAGALVTLLFALVSLLTRDPGFRLPSSAKAAIAAAIPLFVASVVTALATNLPLSYQEFDPQDLAEKLPDAWSESKTEAQGRIAETRIEILTKNHRLNNLKGQLLSVAMAMEVAAVSAVAVAVAFVLAA